MANLVRNGGQPRLKAMTAHGPHKDTSISAANDPLLVLLQGEKQVEL